MPEGARRILDVGCGEGAFGALLKRRRGCEVHGVERFPPAAAAARRVLDSVTEGDAESARLPFDDGSFDCLVYADVLEHLVDPWRALRDHVRLLRPGGRVVASVPNVRHLGVVLRLLLLGRIDYADEGILDRTHLRFFTRRSLLALLEGAGLAGVALRRECGLSILQGAPARLLGAIPGAGDLVAVRFHATAEKPL